MDTRKYQPMQVGSGTKVHVARKGSNAYGNAGNALCGMKPNRNASYMRVNIAYSDGTPVTCDKCLALLAKLEAAEIKPAMDYALTITSPDGKECAGTYNQKQAQEIIEHLDGNKDYMRMNSPQGDKDIWTHKDGCQLELAKAA